MEPSFNESEQRLLRFLKDEYLEKGSGPTTSHDPATMHRDVMKKFGLDLPQYREIIARFEHYGIVQFNHNAIGAPNGFLCIDPQIVEVVRQLDEQAKQPDSVKEPPNRMEQTKRYFFSKWWFVIPVTLVILVGAIAAFLSHLETILKWFGVNLGGS